MIRFEDVTIRYADAAAPVVQNVTFAVPEGELCLVIGPTGSGKSTLLGAINGLVPHFTGGTLSGRVEVCGRDTRDHRPRDLADVVGVVGQDPLAMFVTDTVEDELAYGMESLGLPPEVMRTRVEETLDLLGLAELRARPIGTLSGGQQQRVAIGAVLTMHPQVLVLDEPTSALDPSAAEDVLAALQRLVHDLGVTVVLAEHRLERVVQYADRVIFVPGNGSALEIGAPDDVMATSSVAPPVVRLGRLAEWKPLPLSVRDARRQAGALRDRLARATTGRRQQPISQAPVASLDAVRVEYGRRVAVRDVRLEARPGEIVALMGRNGAGKSSLLQSMVGLVPRARGSIRIDGIDPAEQKPPRIVRAVGLVPQDPGALLYAETVAEECRNADRDLGAPEGRCRELLDRLAPDVPSDRHPRDLSEGQRIALALAIVLGGEPAVVLLDEPTRGLDYGAKERLTAMLEDLADRARTVIFATHDVELVAELATRVVVMAEGEIVADGPTRDVVVASPMFAPQVAKVLRPQPWLTVRDVADALEVAG
ncbi:MAG TPA: ATP-binding cassette domain-containing protein [Actinopolymorphaceae bacterium]